MLTKAEKAAIVAEVASVAATAQAAIAFEYRGMSVADMTNLRRSARQAGVYMRVVKNTLARLAVQGTGYECMGDSLVGPLVLAFSGAEPSAAARVIRDFAKTNEKLVVKVVALNGQLLSAKDLETVATLPTKDEAIARLMGCMKAPIEKFVRTLAEPGNKLARALAAVRDQKAA